MHYSAKRLDVAKMAGVAESTVSRALKDNPHISASTKEKVRKAAEKLNYIPNRQAALFFSKKTCRLGFVVKSYKSFPPFSRAYFPAVLDGAVLAAEEQCYSVSVILDKKEGEFKDLVRIVKSKEVDGLLFSIIPMEDQRLEELRKNSIPFVLINDCRNGVNSVDASPLKGMKKAFEYAVKMKHRRIGFITGDMAYRNARDRLDVFNQLSDQFKIEKVVVEGDFSRTNGYCLAGKLLQSKLSPTLIMTSCDRVAIGVLDYCRDHKIDVPDEVSIIGYDNLAPASDVNPRLTTIDNPVTQTAFEATKLLIDILEKRLNGPLNKQLDTGFIVRDSSGFCKKGGKNERI